MKPTLLLIFFLILPLVGFSHEGGHTHSGDFIKIWHLKNGKKESGNFLFGNSFEMTIEQKNGKVVTLPLSLLSKTDRKIANQKIQRYEHIHHPYQQWIIKKISPSSHGNPYWLYYLAFSFFILLFLFSKKHFSVQIVIYSSILFLVFWACKTDPGLSQNSTTNTTLGIPKTSISFLDSAFNPYKKTVSTSYDDFYYYVNSNGLPEHNMMVGITSWQQQVPITQNYTGPNHWSIPLKPVYETSPLSTKSNFMKGAVALAVNGIPIFNALNNRGEDSFAIGELDQWGGHCGRADDYHYHAAPLHLMVTSGLKPIAFALDGFPVYASKEPDGTPMKTLDINHGHEYGNSYHYHGTTDYPYVIGSMRGKVALDPTTPAPENQILPQAFANPVRPALTALKGAYIINFEQINSSTYQLTYLLNNKKCSVKYSWVGNNYTFVFTDGNGVVTTENYVRK